MNEKGFTLIELIGVMVIIAIVAAIGFKKGYEASEAANRTVVINVVQVLNTNETLVWATTLMDGEYRNDLNVWVRSDEILDAGREVRFVSMSPTGAVVEVKGQRATLTRIPSTPATAARWGPSST